MNSSLQRKSLVIFVGTSLSIGVGVLFQSYLAAHIGTGQEADVFYLGTTLPTLLATAILGSASSALIRFATESPRLFALRESGSLPRKLAAIAGFFSLGMGAAAAGMWLDVIPVYSADVRHGVAEFLLITTLVPPLAMVAGSGAVLGLSRYRFVVGTYGGAVNGVGLFAATLALSPVGLKAPELGIAVDIGYIAQALFVSSVLRSASGAADIPRPEAASVARKATVAFLFLMVASAIYKSQPVVERTVGAAVGAGIPAALGYEDKITSALMLLAAFGFAMAALPSLSLLLSKGDTRSAARHVRTALIATSASTVAAVAFGAVAAGDLVRVLYERGAFGPHAATVTRTLILFALPSIVFGALAGPIVSVAYAAGRIQHVARTGVVGFAVGTATTIALAATVGYRGIVLGTAAGFAFTFVVFAARIGTILPEWSWREFVEERWTAVVRTVLLVTVAAAGSHALVSRIHGGTIGGMIGLAVELFATFGIGLGSVWLLRDRAGNLNDNTARRRGSVLWVTLGGRKVASSRVRAFQVSDALEEAGIRSKCIVGAGVTGRMRTLLELCRLGRPTVVVVQKLLLGAAMVRVLRRLSAVLVWECDDALHIGFPGTPANEIRRAQRLVETVLSHADLVTTSNPLLAQDFLPPSGEVMAFVGPSPPIRRGTPCRERIVVWLGSASTATHLDLLDDLPQRLRGVGWQCVAIGAPSHVASNGWRCVQWSPAAQEYWLGRAMVGVMPQASDPWSDRKQGYKLLEYMAHGLVPVASDVLPARLLMGDPRLAEFLLPAGGDWVTAVESAAYHRSDLLPCLQAIVDEHSMAARFDHLDQARRPSDGVMKVAMICAQAPPVYGGAGTQALALAKRLCQRGVTVELLAGNQMLAVAVEEIDGVTIRRCPAERFIRCLPVRLAEIVRTTVFGAWLAIQLAVRRYDVYHMHGNYWYSLAPAIVGRIKGVPVVLKVTQLGDDDAQTIAEKRWRSLALGRLYSLPSATASTVIALNTEILKRHQELLPDIPVLSLPNGVDVARFTMSSDRRAEQRRTLGIQPDTIVVLFVGYLTERKGVTDLLEGWIAHADQRGAEGHEAQLLLAGPDRGVYRHISSAAVKVATSDRARRAGVRVLEHLSSDMMPALYAAADVFVLPSRAEGMPNSLLEALAAGLPAIAGSVPGITELLDRDSRNVLLGEITPEAIQTAIECVAYSGLVHDRAARLPPGYSLDVIADRYVRLYQDLTDGGPLGPERVETVAEQHPADSHVRRELALDQRQHAEKVAGQQPSDSHAWARPAPDERGVGDQADQARQGQVRGVYENGHARPETA